MANTSEANVRVVKSLPAGAPTSYSRGDNVSFLLKVDNRQGLYEALNVVTTDTLPAGLTYTSAEISYDNGATWQTPTGQNAAGATVSTTTAAGAGGTTIVTLPPVRRIDKDGKVWGGTSSIATQLGTQDVLYRINTTVSSTAIGTLTNQSNVTTGSYEATGNLADNASSLPITVTAADLSITKTNGGTAVNASGTTTYTIRVTNSGPSTVTDALLKDPAVAGLNITGVTCSTAASNTCSTAPTVAALQGAGVTLPSLASGAFYEITLTGTVTAMSGTIANTANVTSSVKRTDGTANNQSVTDTDTVTPVADLSITKTGPSTAVAGTQITYTLTLTNNGPSAANGATYLDNAPGSLTNVTATCIVPSGSTATCAAPSVTASTNRVAGSVPTFPSGSSVQIQITGTIPAGTSLSSISNTASITAPTGTTDPVTTNNNTSSTPVVTSITKSAAISVTKDDGVTTVKSNDTVTYTITVRNDGPSTTTVNFVDTNFSGVTLSNWRCTAVTGTAVCPAASSLPASGGYSNSLLNMPTGSSITFQVDGTVTATSGTLRNTVNVTLPSGVTDTSAGGTADNTATDTDTLAALPPILGITKAVDTNMVKVVSDDPNNTGTAPLTAAQLSPVQVVYTLVVSNTGASAATNVVVKDTLPTGLTYVSAVNGTGTALTNTGTAPEMVFTLPTLAAGASETIRVTARVNINANTNQSAYLNTATAQSTEITTPVSSAQVRTDVLYTKLFKQVHNVGAAPTATMPQPSPAWSSTGTGLPKEVLEYCIDFKNYGTTNLNNYSVKDVVPSNTTYVAGSATVFQGAMNTAPISTSPTVMPGVTASYDSATNTVSTTTFTLPAGTAGSLCFRATIN